MPMRWIPRWRRSFPSMRQKETGSSTRGVLPSLPTVKGGYILKVSQDLLTIMEITTGKRPSVFAITTQDITPYGNGLYHLNSIMQPCVATQAPVVGVAITAESVVPGCATGASHIVDIEEAVRFSIEVAKKFGAGRCAFYDEEEFQRIISLYGSMQPSADTRRKGSS